MYYPQSGSCTCAVRINTAGFVGIPCAAQRRRAEGDEGVTTTL
jgi:hypothetical protein